MQWDLVEAMEATEAARRNPAGFRFVEALEATEAGPGEAQPGFGSCDVTRRKDHARSAFGMHSLCLGITTEG